MIQQLGLEGRPQEVDPPLDVLDFPDERVRDKLIIRKLGASCVDCEPGRIALARQYAYMTDRLEVPDAALLVEERRPCSHL